MLPLIVFTLLFALAARRIDAALRRALVDFFGAIAAAMTTIVDWIIAAAPIGIFALVTAAASRAGVGLAGAMLYYVVAICAALVLFALLHVSGRVDCRPDSARLVYARRAAGAGRRARHELIAGVAPGAGRERSHARARLDGDRLRTAAVGVDVQGGDADLLAGRHAVSRQAVWRRAGHDGASSRSCSPSWRSASRFLACRRARNSCSRRSS